jgi:multidrug efflux system membrane fusion protein
VDTEKNVVIVPVAAVQHGPDSTFIYVVKPDKTVEVQDIKEGIEQGDEAVVMAGIKPGDLCVTVGVDKLQAGTKVVVRAPASTQPTTGPTTQPHPRRSNS